MRVADGADLSMLDQRSGAFLSQFFKEPPPIVAFVRSEAAQLARVAAVELPAELGVVTFLRRTMNVENSLQGGVDEGCYFEYLDALICPVTVVLARGFTVENVASIAARPESSCNCDYSRSSTRQTAI